MEKERLVFSIERFDHYYDSINNKLNVFLGLSTFILGGLIAGYPTLVDKVECGICTYVIMGILFILSLSIMLMVAATSIPYLKKGKNSLIFFGNLAKMDESQFLHQSSIESEEDALNDMRRQVHLLAKGLDSKFKKLRCAGILLIVQFLIFIPLVLIILKNFK